MAGAPLSRGARRTCDITPLRGLTPATQGRPLAAFSALSVVASRARQAGGHQGEDTTENAESAEGQAAVLRMDSPAARAQDRLEIAVARAAPRQVPLSKRCERCLERSSSPSERPGDERGAQRAACAFISWLRAWSV